MPAFRLILYYKYKCLGLGAEGVADRSQFAPSVSVEKRMSGEIPVEIRIIGIWEAELWSEEIVFSS